MISFKCPSCQKSIKAPEMQAGKHGKCPKCHTKMIVPELVPATAPPSVPVPATADATRKNTLVWVGSGLGLLIFLVGIAGTVYWVTRPATAAVTKEGEVEEPVVSPVSSEQKKQGKRKAITPEQARNLTPKQRANLTPRQRKRLRQFLKDDSKEPLEAPKQLEGTIPTLEQAERMLRKAADALVFGETQSSFDLGNSDLICSLGNVQKKVIQSYEITAKKGSGSVGWGNFKFTIILIYESVAGTPIRKKHEVRVNFDDPPIHGEKKQKHWIVMGFPF